MSSVRAKFIRSVSSAYVQRMNMTNVNFAKIRQLWGFLGRLMIPAFGVKVHKDTINGLRSEWLLPKQHLDGKLLLYLHGGGYVVGGCDMHRQMVSHIARAGHIRALLPEYRLAPEHKFPAAIDDAVGVYRFLLASGVMPDDIIFAGDSAGGGLCIATLLELRDAGEALPAAVVLLSPFLDATGSGDTMQTRALQDPWFRAEDLTMIVAHYCEQQQRHLPLVSPIFADISGLPPMLIQVGDDEILLSDARRLKDKCDAAEIEVELEVWPEMWHVFQMFVGKMPEAGAAIDKIGRFIRCQWAA